MAESRVSRQQSIVEGLSSASPSPSTQKTPIFRASETSDAPPSLSLGDSEPLVSSLNEPLNYGSRSTQPAVLTTSSKTVVEKRSGRSPWYDANGVPRQAYVIGVAGGSASGKTSVATRILTRLNVPTVAVVSQDSFYKPLTPEQSKLAFENNWDFDCEAAFDQELLKQCIIDLKNGRAVDVPVYSFVHHQRMDETKYLYGASVIIVEGLFVLSDPEIRDLLDLKLFVQADSDLMLARRITRDTKERGREIGGIIDHYLRWVKPAMDNQIQPTSKWADLIVPGQRNEVAVDVVAQHVRKQLDARALRFRSELGKIATNEANKQTGSNPATLSSTAGRSLLVPMSRTTSSASLTGSGVPCTNNLTQAILPPSVHLLEPTPQLLGLLTILHEATSKDFVFYTDRVCRILMEETLNFLPHTEKTVRCGGDGAEWKGKVLDTSNVCAISIQRSGSVFLKAARRAIPALTEGSLLIQSSDEDGEPQLYDVSLPDNLRKRSSAESAHVILLDAQIGTGAAAFMAIRVLLDHGVPETNIVFVSILASAKGGIWALSRAVSSGDCSARATFALCLDTLTSMTSFTSQFPKVKIVLAGVDGGLKKCRVEYPRTENGGRRASEIGSNLTARVQERGGEADSQQSSGSKTKLLWTILPGMGSIGE